MNKSPIIVDQFTNYLVQRYSPQLKYWSTWYNLYNRSKLAERALNGCRKRYPEDQFRLVRYDHKEEVIA